MNIRNTSWHFRLINWACKDGNYPKSLCAYFWAVVGLVLLWSVCLWWLFPIVLLIEKLGYHPEDPKSKEHKEPKVHKGPGLLRAYVSAKKQRVCPLIHVVEPPDAS